MLPPTQTAPMADTWEGYQHFPSSSEVLALLHAGHLLIGVVIKWMDENEIHLPLLI